MNKQKDLFAYVSFSIWSGFPDLDQFGICSPLAGSCVQDKSWRNSIFRQRRKIKVFAGTRVPAFTREKIMLNCQPPIKSAQLTCIQIQVEKDCKCCIWCHSLFFGHHSCHFTVFDCQKYKSKSRTSPSDMDATTEHLNFSEIILKISKRF